MFLPEAKRRRGSRTPMLPRDPRKNLKGFHCIAWVNLSTDMHQCFLFGFTVFDVQKKLHLTHTRTHSFFRSAFFIFCAEYRPKVKEETPGLSIGDVAKKLGEMWNKTSAEEKQPYEKKAAKLKEKYEKVFFFSPVNKNIFKSVLLGFIRICSF